MITTQKRISLLALVLFIMLTLSLLLTACGKGGDTPTGDNTTTGVSDTETPAATPDDTTEPSNTPSETEPTSPGTSEIPGISKPSDPSTHKHNQELVDYIDSEDIQYLNNVSGIDVKNALKEIENEYSEYISDYITNEMITVALVTNGPLPQFRKNNMSGISNEVFNQVTDFLISKGEASLNFTDPKQNMAALWIATSMIFGQDDCDDPGFDNCYLIDAALGRAYDSSINITNSFSSMYIALHAPMFE